MYVFKAYHGSEDIAEKCGLKNISKRCEKDRVVLL